MTAQLTFTIYAHGTRTKARLVKLESKPKYGHCKCACCDSSANMAFIAEATQYGFYEDRHWEVYNCSACQRNTAFQYEVKVSLSRTIERLK
jgi:Zn finger protein HypA/HybF involved in hydrogenase expression